jgi:hypothetical protein
MEALLGFLLLIGACVLAAGVVARLLKPSAPKIAADWEAPKADLLPYSKRNFFFSAAERSFYEVLRRLAPDHPLFAKVRLADLVYVSKGAASRQSHLNRIDRKHLDFVLCGKDFAPIVAIELDDSSHDDKQRQSRDEFVDRVLATAGLPIVHVWVKRGYVMDELRQLLAPYLQLEQPPVIASPDAKYMPPKS